MSASHSSATLRLDPFEDVLARFRSGGLVLLVDDTDRENEGDVVLATEAVSPEAISFLMRYARGLICVSIPGEIARRLDIPLQVTTNNSPYQTPFGVSVDSARILPNGVTARARAETMKQLIDPHARGEDFVSPGHVFPLIANPAGVLGRPGHTEGVFDLARLAGLTPSGVLCEVLNEDGSMARGHDLAEFAKRHDLLVTSVEAIKEFRARNEIAVRVVSSREMESDFGPCTEWVFAEDAGGKEHIAVVKGDVSGTASTAPLVRIHSECLTGDVFGSRRCDCGPQLAGAMELIAGEGRGVILYLRQEGRGIGLENKVRAYALQDQGRDTVEANIELGFQPDERNFAVAAHMLRALNIGRIRLITNNPTKSATLSRHGIVVEERVAMIPTPDPCSVKYLATKKEKLGHLL
jgi:3,4-dihydroxy 2-butanone 4-phosphate synthase/GTP cyclohydrolase II